ncbi:hypothetical protein [Algibacter agarivorans]
MKTLIMIISVLGFIILSNCTQKIDVNKLLDNSEIRSDIFEAIANDHDQMTLFMESIQSNKHAMQMMQGHYMMKGNMMKDSMMMHNMMGNMMKNEKMMEKMIQMMNNEGMMSNECMQAMSKTMNDKGMHISGMEMNQDEDNK